VAAAALGGGNTQAADWDRAQHDPWSAEVCVIGFATTVSGIATVKELYAGIYDSAHLIFHGPSVRRKIGVMY